MPTWKKVVVSGSSAHLTQVTASSAVLVGTNQVITTSQATTVLTGSFTGSFVGSGAGLTSIPNNALSNSSITVTAGSGLITGGSVSLGGSVTVDVGAGDGISIAADAVGIKTGSAISSNNTILKWDTSGKQFAASSITDSGTIIAGASSIQLSGGSSSLTGSFTGSFVGLGSGLTGITATSATNATNAALTQIYDSSSAAGTFYPTFVNGTSGNLSQSIDSALTYVPNTDTLSAGNITLSGDIAVNGGDITTSGASFNIATSATSVAIGATTNGSVVTVGDLAVNGATSADITTTNTGTATLFNANATTLNIGGAATTIGIGAATGTTTVNNNLSVIGTLYVQGPVTAISSSNLYVADQFILVASGSTLNTDGGMVVDRGSDASGNIAFGYDATTRRWGYQNGLVDTTNAIDPTASNGVSGSFAGIIFTEASHGATKPTTGEFAVLGASYIASNEDIWIFS